MDEVEAALTVWRAGFYAAVELAAAIAESKIDPEWPNDDQSVQCRVIADEIRRMTPPHE